MPNCYSCGISPPSDVNPLPENGLKAVDLLPRVEKDVTHRLLEEGEFGLGDDVWYRFASGIDMIVADATTPRKEGFTVRLNGASARDGQLDEIRMTRLRR